MKKYSVAYFFLLILHCFLGSHIAIGKNKYTVKFKQPDSVPAPVFSSATITKDNYSSVEWSVSDNKNIQKFNIYRLSTTNSNVWFLAGQVGYTSKLIFTDLATFPSANSYKYRIASVDGCGNEVFCAKEVNTIKLKVSKTLTSGNSLEWNTYDGFNTENYVIYRGTQSTNLAPIDTIPTDNSKYLDSRTTNETNYYQIEAITRLDDSPKSKKLSLSLSNVASNIATLSPKDTNEITEVIIHPNPMTINSMVVFPNETGQKYQLSIMSLTGQMVYTRQIQSGEIEIERGNLKEGVYILQLTGKNTYTTKLVVGKNKL